MLATLWNGWCGTHEEIVIMLMLFVVSSIIILIVNVVVLSHVAPGLTVLVLLGVNGDLCNELSMLC
jgi:hypothetical protein